MNNMRILPVLFLAIMLSSPAVHASHVAGIVKRPVLLQRVEPECSHRCAPVVLEAVIAKDGSVRDAKIVEGTSSECADAAIEALSKWKYEPATLNTQPVDTIWKYRVSRCWITPID
ncbi:MAG TPA: energy transducer TonB [Thermoanaerobaculia bacterium]|nr:energy transducer TonB [Thermoanaerobaculia bacterium]